MEGDRIDGEGRSTGGGGRGRVVSRVRDGMGVGFEHFK